MDVTSACNCVMSWSFVKSMYGYCCCAASSSCTDATNPLPRRSSTELIPMRVGKVTNVFRLELSTTSITTQSRLNGCSGSSIMLWRFPQPSSRRVPRPIICVNLTGDLVGEARTMHPIRQSSYPSVRTATLTRILISPRLWRSILSARSGSTPHTASALTPLIRNISAKSLACLMSTAKITVCRSPP